MTNVTFPQLIQRGCGIDVHLKVVVVTIHGVGFTANIDPDPFYDSRAGRNRQYIRIHPARSNGTNGCIGLRANKAQLIRARELIRKSLNKGLTIKLHVQIGGN